MKKLAVMLSMTSFVINQSCDSKDQEIDLQGNDLFEKRFSGPLFS